jgi:malate synthase
VSSDDSSKKLREPLTMEEYENQMVMLAYESAKKKLESGRATSQLETHFLKIGTARAALEMEKLRADVELTKEKIRSESEGKRVEEAVQKAVDALTTYSVTYNG